MSLSSGAFTGRSPDPGAGVLRLLGPARALFPATRRRPPRCPFAGRWAVLHNPGMADALADRLLDAQVAWLLRELSGKRFAAVVARDVDDVLAVAGNLIVRDVVDADAVKSAAR